MNIMDLKPPQDLSRCDDSQLFQHIRQGNKLALQRVMDKYYNELHLHVIDVLSEKDLVEDIITRAFISFWLVKGSVVTIPLIEFLHYLVRCELLTSVKLSKQLTFRYLDRISEYEPLFERLEKSGISRMTDSVILNSLPPDYIDSKHGKSGKSYRRVTLECYETHKQLCRLFNQDIKQSRGMILHRMSLHSSNV